jgi:hypothetical protein
MPFVAPLTRAPRKVHSFLFTRHSPLASPHKAMTPSPPPPPPLSQAKDVAYALCCASDSSTSEPALVAFYLSELSSRLTAQGDTPPTGQALANSLSLAYADLGRWMSGGGGGGHDLRGKIEPVLDRLDGGTALAAEADYARAVETAFRVH